MSAQHTQGTFFRDFLSKLRKPCGRTTGHGESCVAGYTCGACGEKSYAADIIEQQAKELAAARALLALAHAHINPSSIDPEKAKTGPVADAYINTIVRRFLEGGAA